MKLALAFMYMDSDIAWLRLHLPVWMDSGVFDGAVAVNGEPEDVRCEFPGYVNHVARSPFQNNFGAQGNVLISCCGFGGYDAMLRVDPDELMFPDDMRKVRAALEAYPDRLLGLARRHFVGDRLHVHPDWHPDFQWRAWWLNNGTHYDDDAKVHELPTGDRLELPGAVLYHYGYIIPDSERAYKIALYDAIANGTALPTKAEYANWKLDIPRVEYHGEQPLDPQVIGLRAPFEPQPS